MTEGQVLVLTSHRADWHRGTSLIRNRPPLAPYSRTLHRSLWWS